MSADIMEVSMQKSLLANTAKRVSQAPKVKKPSKSRGRKKGAAAAAATQINTWETDPGLGDQPTGGSFVQRPVPTLSQAPLPTKITNPGVAPSPGQHNTDTAAFRYW